MVFSENFQCFRRILYEIYHSHLKNHQNFKGDMTKDQSIDNNTLRQHIEAYFFIKAR